MGTADLTWKRSERVYAVVETLLRQRPPPRDGREPIKRKHLLNVKLRLRFQECGVDRVGWAVACCAWFEGMRIGHLLRKERGDVVWKPKRRRNRGRVSIENEEGGTGVARRWFYRLCQLKWTRAIASSCARSSEWGSEGRRRRQEGQLLIRCNGI